MELFKKKPKSDQAPDPAKIPLGGMAGEAKRTLGGRGRSIDEQVEKTITGARKTRTRSV
jgi:hypothetical protein